jgi:polygalacturonase
MVPAGDIIMRKRYMSIINFASMALGLILSGVGFAVAQTENPAKPSNVSAAIGGIGTYDIRNYGAIGDGKTLNTAAIQAAIDACTKDNGGVVLVPAGDFLTGTIELKSNITLRLAAAARILGSGKIEDYRAGTGIPRGNGNKVLIYASEAKNVAIEGNGTIDGQGASFYTGKGDGTGPGGPSGKQVNVDRPHLMIFYRCENLSIRDVSLEKSA